MFHRIGDYAINGTDNILISSIVNITTTGMYYNYLSLTSVLKSVISSIMTAPTSSYGNLNVDSDLKTKENVFNLINYICYFITGMAVVGFYFCVNKFIVLWIGKKFLISDICVIILCLNLYLSCIVMPLATIKNSTGLYYQDRYVPLLQAIVNLIVSIIAGLNFGLAGILLGTAVSYITIAITLKPYYIYKQIFNKLPNRYYINFLKNAFVVTFVICGLKFLFSYIVISNILVEMIVQGIISVIVFTIVFIIITYRTKEYGYYKDLVVGYIGRNK